MQTLGTLLTCDFHQCATRTVVHGRCKPDVSQTVSTIEERQSDLSTREKAGFYPFGYDGQGFSGDLSVTLSQHLDAAAAHFSPSDQDRDH